PRHSAAEAAMRRAAVGLLCGRLALAPATPGWGQGKGKKKSDRPVGVERLRADLQSRTPSVRKRALDTVQHYLYWELAPEVVPLVDDAEVRKDAMYACGRLGWDARAAVPGLLKALKDRDPEVRRVAAEALGHVGESGKGALGGLVAALGDPDARVRSAAAEAIGCYRDEGRPAFAALLRALKDPDAEVGVSAARAIGWVAADMPAAVEALLPL